MPALRGARAVAVGQLGPVDAVRQVLAEQVERPHERLAVGNVQRVAPCSAARSSRIVLGDHHARAPAIAHT